MKKIALFEFEDLSWFPNTIRESMTDFLRYFLTATNFYQPVTPIITDALRKSGSNTIIDLCSGSGGAIEKVLENINSATGEKVEIILTDKFSNLNAYRYLEKRSVGGIRHISMPVDATDVPPELRGLRTIFSGFHHFDAKDAKAVISNAVQNEQAIGIFDGGDKNLLTILGIIIFHPIAFLILTPFFRPYRFSRFVFTYLIPVIPFCTVWDGVVSIMRLYQPEELLAMAQSIDDKNYQWTAGKVRNKYFMNVTYLVGYPLNKSSNFQD
jgi:hypothetical protein